MPNKLSLQERERYSQQMIMPEVGEGGQEKLRSARVLIIGLGGLGTPVAQYLARAGIGTIGLVENDTVHRTNLHRQIFYTVADVGKKKILVAEQAIKEINPEVTVESHKTFLSKTNAIDIIRWYDIIVDATDNFTSRYLINDTCFFAGNPLVFASVFRFEGQVTVFDSQGGPCYRCLYPEPPDTTQNCSDAGVMGSVAGIIGTVAATEVIKHILGVGGSLIGRLVTLDALQMRWKELRIEKNISCVLCGSEPTIRSVKITATNTPLPHSLPVMTTDITVEELKRRFDAGEKPFLLDVRETSEYDVCNLGGKLIPLSTLPGHLDDLDPKEEIVVYCKMGGRSQQAAKFLRSKGFTNVVNLTGGIMEWAKKIDPAMKRY